MKNFTLFLLACFSASTIALAQNPLTVSLNLSNGINEGPEGVAVTFAIQSGGAVLSDVIATGANGMASTVFDLPAGTMQGMVFATYFDCDSLETILTSTFSANALGGLSPVDMMGTWCNGGGIDCYPYLTADSTLTGTWAFEVNDAPEDASFVWSVDGVVVADMYASEFVWGLSPGAIYTVCVNMFSETCGEWNNCIVVDLGSGGGGNTNDCSISFFAAQTMDTDSSLVANSVDVFIAGFDEAAQYYWDFGDEGFSTEAFPTHIYDGNGPYVLCLTATWPMTPAGEVCAATYCDTLELDEGGFLGFLDGFVVNVYAEGTVVNGMEEAPVLLEANLYPNPVVAGAEFNWVVDQNLERIEVLDAMGRSLRVLQGTAAQRGSCSTATWKSGTYFVRFFHTTGTSNTQRMIIQ